MLTLLHTLSTYSIFKMFALCLECFHNESFICVLYISFLTWKPTEGLKLEKRADPNLIEHLFYRVIPLYFLATICLQCCFLKQHLLKCWGFLVSWFSKAFFLDQNFSDHIKNWSLQIKPNKKIHITSVILKFWQGKEPTTAILPLNLLKHEVSWAYSEHM